MLGYDLVLTDLDIIIMSHKLITPGFWMMMGQKIIFRSWWYYWDSLKL